MKTPPVDLTTPTLDLTTAPRTRRALNRLPWSADDRERGDVPGWVLVTLMTAGLVVLLWGVAGPALTARRRSRSPG